MEEAYSNSCISFLFYSKFELTIQTYLEINYYKHFLLYSLTPFTLYLWREKSV